MKKEVKNLQVGIRFKFESKKPTSLKNHLDATLLRRKSFCKKGVQKVLPSNPDTARNTGRIL